MLWECFAAAPGTSCAMCAWQYISDVGLFRSGPGHHVRDSSAMSRSAVGLFAAARVFCEGLPQYVKSTTEFISSSVHVLRGTAAVQVGTARYSRSKNLCRYAVC
jgi:hypothetical protein